MVRSGDNLKPFTSVIKYIFNKLGCLALAGFASIF